MPDQCALQNALIDDLNVNLMIAATPTVQSVANASAKLTDCISSLFPSFLCVATETTDEETLRQQEKINVEFYQIQEAIWLSLTSQCLAG